MIFSSCVYLQRKDEWLMLYRNKKKQDANHNKWIGVGGKCDQLEDIDDCARREVKEETGFIVDQLRYEGMLYFSYDAGEDETISIYSCTKFHGRQSTCDEGELKWVKQEDILSLPLWEGDRIFLKKMMQEERKPFVLWLHYDENGRLNSVKEDTL